MVRGWLLGSDTVLDMRRPVAPQNLKRRILKDALRENDLRDAAFRRMIRSVPKGRVFDIWQGRRGSRLSAVPPGSGAAAPQRTAPRVTLATNRGRWRRDQAQG